MPIPYANATWTPDLSDIDPRHMPGEAALAALRGQGISDEDIHTALHTQHQQRKNAVPILPLRVILGLEQIRRGARGPVDPISHAIASTKPRPRSTGGTHITRAKIWAASVRTGSHDEAAFIRPITEATKRKLNNYAFRIYKHARALASQARKGVRALNAHEIHLMDFLSTSRDLLFTLIDEVHFRKGWCVLAYETLADRTGKCRATIAEHLTRLKRLGLIEWIRRYDLEEDESGSRSVQTSNLYRIAVPAWLIDAIGIPSPIPDDEAVRRDQQLEDHAAMLADASPAEPGVKAALLSAAARIAGRTLHTHHPSESRKLIDPHYDIYIKEPGKWNGPSRAIKSP